MGGRALLPGVKRARWLGSSPGQRRSPDVLCVRVFDDERCSRRDCGNACQVCLLHPGLWFQRSVVGSWMGV
eukprot:scaffold6446_cov104-Isochrysis_galbana.AAC.11